MRVWRKCVFRKNITQVERWNKTGLKLDIKVLQPERLWKLKHSGCLFKKVQQRHVVYRSMSIKSTSQELLLFIIFLHLINTIKHSKVTLFNLRDHKAFPRQFRGSIPAIPSPLYFNLQCGTGSDSWQF